MVEKLYYNYKMNVISLIICCLLSIPLFAQECSSDSYYIKQNYFNEGIVAYYLSAVDINTGDSNIPFFEYLITTNDINCNDLQYPSGINLILDFSINIYSPEIGLTLSQDIMTGKIKLSNISSEVIFNNADLNYSTTSVSGADFSLINYTGPTDLNADEYQMIISSVLASGKLPDGMFTFNFNLSSEDGTQLGEAISKTINVNEPEYIHLITPGGSLADTSNNIIYTTFPIFMWNSDPCIACESEIRVCEFNTQIHSSPIDALNDITSLPNITGDEYYTINDNINSFQYPSTEAKDLEAGKLYVWQLKRKYQSTLGQEEIFSDIHIFKVFDPFVSNTSENNLEVIRLLVGDEKYNELFLETGMLSEYNSLEGTIILNGNPISLSELNQIISQIQNGTINIQEIIVE